MCSLATSSTSAFCPGTRYARTDVVSFAICRSRTWTAKCVGGRVPVCKVSPVRASKSEVFPLDWSPAITIYTILWSADIQEDHKKFLSWYNWSNLPVAVLMHPQQKIDLTLPKDLGAQSHQKDSICYRASSATWCCINSSISIGTRIQCCSQGDHIRDVSTSREIA